MKKSHGYDSNLDSGNNQSRFPWSPYGALRSLAVVFGLFLAASLFYSLGTSANSTAADLRAEKVAALVTKIDAVTAESADPRLLFSGAHLTVLDGERVSTWRCLFSTYLNAQETLEERGWIFFPYSISGEPLYGFLSSGEDAVRIIGELRTDGLFNQLEFTLKGEKHLFFLKSPLYLCTTKSGELLYIFYDEQETFHVLSEWTYGAFYFTDGGEPPTSE